MYLLQLLFHSCRFHLFDRGKPLEIAPAKTAWWLYRMLLLQVFVVYHWSLYTRTNSSGRRMAWYLCELLAASLVCSNTVFPDRLPASAWTHLCASGWDRLPSAGRHVLCRDQPLWDKNLWQISGCKCFRLWTSQRDGIHCWLDSQLYTTQLDYLNFDPLMYYVV